MVGHSHSLGFYIGGKMNQEEYLKFHRSFCDQMIAITKLKNSDYANSLDPFANFRMCELMGVASSMQGFLTRMLDKIARINTFAQRGTLAVKSESVHDALMDLANYCALLSGFIKSETEAFHDSLPEWGGGAKVKEEQLDLEIKYPPEVNV